MLTRLSVFTDEKVIINPGADSRIFQRKSVTPLSLDFMWGVNY
jgi:hypothetical protein